MKLEDLKKQLIDIDNPGLRRFCNDLLIYMAERESKPTFIIQVHNVPVDETEIFLKLSESIGDTKDGIDRWIDKGIQNGTIIDHRPEV